MNAEYQKICLIIPYFGKWPNYFEYFLKSCSFNSTIDWLFFTDCPRPKDCPSNIKIIKGSLKELEKMASRNLHVAAKIPYSYKVCDFKPAFGKIFEDYIKDYDFWGYADIDAVYGNMRHFLSEEILSKHDIVTGYDHSLAGPFTIFKKEHINLFSGNKDHKNVFESQEMFGFDETNFIYRENIFLQTQQKPNIKSMSHYISELIAKNEVKVAAMPLVFNIRPEDRVAINFNSGGLHDDKGNKIFSAHFLLIRVNNKLRLPKVKKVPSSFCINGCGIYTSKKPSPFTHLLTFAKIWMIGTFKVQAGTLLKKFLPKIYYFYKKFF